jgi:hypothetical protein
MGIFRLTEAVDAGELPASSSTPASAQTRAVTPAPYPFDGSWRRVAVQAVGLWVATRVALAAFTYFAVLFHLGLTGAVSTPLTPADLLASWQKWDADWYVSIARHGYNQAQATAFFPLYPLLVHAAALLTGGNWTLSGLLVANLGTLGGFIGLALLAAYEAGTERAGWFAVRMAAAYPLAFFLAAPYTEGPFLAFAAFALLCARRSWWLWAAACVFLATLTRPTGVILVVPLFYEYTRQLGLWRRATWQAGSWQRIPAPRRLGEVATLVLAAPAAFGAYMLFLRARFGDPLLFVHAEEKYWNHTSVTAIAASTTPDTLAHAAQSIALTFDQARSLVDLGAVAVFILLTVAMVRRLPVLYVLYMVGLLVLCLSSPRPDRLGIFVSAGRYLCAAIPAFLLLGRWAERRPWLDMLLVSGGFLLQAVFAAFFLAGGWMV